MAFTVKGTFPFYRRLDPSDQTNSGSRSFMHKKIWRLACRIMTSLKRRWKTTDDPYGRFGRTPDRTNVSNYTGEM